MPDPESREKIVEAVRADPVVKAVVDAGAPGLVDRRAPPSSTVTTQAGDTVATPTTTEEQNRATVGQRRVNLIWESQQAAIATAVVAVVLYVSARITLAILDKEATEQQTAMAVTGFMLLSNIINLVIGFYFGRTNHQKIGGVEQGR